MKPIVLASSSITRHALLAAAGLDFDVAPADVDEGAIKAREIAQGRQVCRMAAVLAEAKALEVARRPSTPDEVLVVGADQTLEFDGRSIDKVSSSCELRGQLSQLRGRRHALHSAVCVARAGIIVWSHTDTAWLAIREFSPAFLDAYLARNGEQVRSSLGGYWFEGEGVQLFDSVDGDYFTVLGLPVLPLLAFLRCVGAIPS